MRPSIQARPITQAVRRTLYPVVVFEYIGKTALTAIGPVSGRHYRFSSPGATLEVDPRDSTSLAAVPNLRKRLGSG